MNSIHEDKEKSRSATPLAERMRPKRLEEVRGQSHLLGEDCLLPKLIRENRVGNLILTGPPGTGKTTLATVIAEESECKLIKLNAVTSNVSELRDSLKLAKYYGAEKCYLFVDEIHRFNKSQQDLLLPDIESGEARLIGATTHNPRYYVNDPLLSRSQLFTLQPLSVEEIETALLDCLKDQDKGLAHRECTSEPKAINQIARLAEGDLRKAYNILEVIVEGLSNEMQFQRMQSPYLRKKEVFVTTVTRMNIMTPLCLIKSMRGNDPDASMYWLAKMLMGGEDPRFIARRLVIFASEDIGLADSRALLMADATFRACETIGLPECELNLAHCVLFLTTCPKSNSATLALAEAKKTIRENPVQSIPSSIQDRHGRNEKYRDKEEEGYLYSHDFPENISGQSYLEKDLEIYKPKSSGAEEKIKDRLNRWHILRSQKRNTERG